MRNKPMNQIKTDEIIYTFNHTQCHGFIAYDENQKGRIPVVIVVHE